VDQAERISHLCRLSLALSVLLLASVIALGADTSLTDDALLNALQGKWDMQGTVMGKPVRYRAEGRRVLEGGFLRLHLVDVATPPRYEAMVFLGYDPKAKDYIAHWLDRFGAGGARVVATGSRDGERIILVYPYPEGAFRNTFTWYPASSSWTLLLEAQQSDQQWSTFASYTLVRPSRVRNPQR
jgi:Protein of unknown function (DUF1579)